jgi:type I restriction enzyme S subunit
MPTLSFGANATRLKILVNSKWLLNMSEWKTYKLGDLVTFQRGHDLTRTQMQKGTYPVAGSNGVIGFHNEFTTKAPGITIGRSGNIGNVYYFETDFWAHNTTLYIKEFKNCDPKFIYYLLQTMNFGGHNSGSAVPSLNRNYIHPIEVKAPDLPTQRQIASILSSLDDKIEINLQMNQTLEAMAQAIFKEWFVNFNFPGFDGELVDGLPKGWKMGKVKEMYKTTSGGTPSRAKEEYYENGTINWVKSKELNGSFIFDTEEKITVDAVKNSSAKLIPKHSVLVAMYGATVGEYAITTRDTTCNQAICAVIEDGSYPFTYFFEYFKINKNNIIGQASGSAQQNISQALIQQLDILIPPIEVVKKYHSVVESMFIKMENNLLQIQSLTQIRDNLLPKLMSGKIRLNRD